MISKKVLPNGSFEAHYWQNTTQAYYLPSSANFSTSKGDGRGPSQLNINTTGFADIRGTIYLWGSLAQKKRGHVKRNAPGPYNITPGIGYSKSYHYDPNFIDSPPPGFELLHNPMNDINYGDVNQNEIVELDDAGLILEALVGIIQLDSLQLLIADVSRDSTISSLDAAIIMQYLDDSIGEIPVYWSDEHTEPSGSLELSDYSISDDRDSLIVTLISDLSAGSYALSGTILFDPTYLAFEEFTFGDPTYHVNLEQPGMIKFSCAQSEDLHNNFGSLSLKFAIPPLGTALQTSIILSTFRLNENPVMSDVSALEISIPTEIFRPLNKIEVLILSQNFPNPFNPSTTIRYGLPEMSDVRIDIYDVAGREVMSVNQHSQQAGWHDLQWNGIDNSGVEVAAGMYFTRLQSGSYTKTIKMLYLK